MKDDLDTICLQCPLPDCDEKSVFCGRAHAELKRYVAELDKAKKERSKTINAARCRRYYRENREKEQARKRADYVGVREI